MHWYRYKNSFFSVDDADSVTFSDILEIDIVLLHTINTRSRPIINFNIFSS